MEVFRYVTESTFDAYSYQLIESKQRFISQISSGDLASRSAEDIDSAALSYAEIKALAAGDERIKEKMDLDVQVDKLKLLKAGYNSQRYRLEDALRNQYPQEERLVQEQIAGLTMDIANVQTHTNGDDFRMELSGKSYTKKVAAGQAILDLCKQGKSADERQIGHYRGCSLWLAFDIHNFVYHITLQNEQQYTITLGDDPLGVITRLDNAFNALPEKLLHQQNMLEKYHRDVVQAKAELAKPFEFEQELKEKSERLSELNILLNIENQGGETLGDIEEGQSERTHEIEHKKSRCAEGR